MDGLNPMEFNRDFTLSILFTFIVLTSQIENNCTIQCNWLQTSLTTVCIGVHCLPAFKKETRILIISDSTLTDIPENTFSGLDNLTKVHIQNSMIGRIKSHSFNTSRTLKDILFSHANLGTIEDHAFERSTFSPGGSFNMYQVNIETIEAFAFFRVSDMVSFTFYGANITTIEPRAFYKISTSKSFHIYMSTIINLHSLALDGFTDMKDVIILRTHIANLHAKTLEAFESDIGEEFSLYGITIDCGCKMRWLLEAREYMSAESLHEVTCSNSRKTPLAVRGESLIALNQTDMCPIRFETTTMSSSTKLPQPTVTLVMLETTTVPLRSNSSSSGTALDQTTSYYLTFSLVITLWNLFFYLI